MRSRFEYILPRSLKEALDFLADHGSQTSIIAGGTDLMIAVRNGDVASRYVVDVSRLEEMRTIAVTEGTLSIGAAVTYHRNRKQPPDSSMGADIGSSRRMRRERSDPQRGNTRWKRCKRITGRGQRAAAAGPSGSGADSVRLVGTKRTFGRGYNWSVPHHSETRRSHNAIHP